MKMMKIRRCFLLIIIVKNQAKTNKNKRTRYDQVAYHYLQQHYEDRCQRIHVLNRWLTLDLENKRQMLEDYYRLNLTDLIARYFDDVELTKKPFLKDYKQLIVAKHFSDAQQAIITDASRATLVLAGAGSGKTTVVVHRVAYLLMVEQISADKILVLAYNRLAVHELRERLYNLVGSHAHGVTIDTFHGLARQITGKAEKEFDDVLKQNPNLLNEICQRYDYLNKEQNFEKRKNNARYQWLLEQAVEELQENPQYYQYIMVDEFQDIDKIQYDIIAHLADLSENHDENDEDDNKTQQLTTLLPIRFGKFSQIHQIGNKDSDYAWDMASWVAQDIQQTLGKLEQNQKIAVIAPRWQIFDTLQHYLEQADIKSQRYNQDENNEFNPLNSVIGQALSQYLSEKPDEKIVGQASAYLENWRLQAGFNHLDTAWRMILQSVADIQDTIHDKLLSTL